MSLETAAAIIGLGALATELFTKIHHFVSTCADAPSIAKDISDEVRDFDYAIHRLRGHIDRTTPITPCGASATDVNQLSLTLQSCMATLSLLSRLMERLLPNVSGMNYLRRVRWGMAAGDLDQLLSRLQRNKSSLNLLMSIWASESSAQTEQSLDTLNDVLKSLLTHNGLSFTPDSAVQPTHLSLRDVVDSTMSRMKASDAISLHGDARSITSKHTHCTTKSNHSLRSILRKTRPYSGRYLLEGSAKSIATSKRGMQWSKLTLGSNQSVFSLPFTEFHLAGRSLAVEEDIAKIKVTVPERGMYSQALYPPYNFSSLSMTKALEKMNLKPMTTSLALQKDQEESIKNDLGVSAHDIEMITKVIKSGAYPDGQFVMVMYKRSARLGEMVLDRACIPDQSSATLHPVLCAAIRVGDWALAQALFDGHLIPDDGCIRPDWRRVALQFIGHEAAISKLLSKGAPVQTIEPNVELPAGNTPLIAACELKNIALVRFLLRNGANAGLKSSTGKTPLHQSVAQPIEPTILKLLVEAGAGIDTLTQEGYTPLSLFVIRQEGPLSDSDSEALDLLLSSGADTTIADHNGNNVLMHATKKGSHEVLRRLLSGNPDLSAMNLLGRTILHEALRSSSFASTAPLLLSHGVNVNIPAADWNTPTMEYFTTHFNSSTDTGISEELVYAHCYMVKELLCAGADMSFVSQTGMTALQHAAAMSWGLPIVKVLVSYGVDIDATTHLGTALLQTIRPQNSEKRASDIQIAHYLLDSGASISKTDANGNTALMFAAQLSDTRVLERALAMGNSVQLGQRNRFGRTALHAAINWGSAAAVRMLLQAGADVLAVDDNERTPLHVALVRHFASSDGDLDVCQMLLESGACTAMKDRAGDTVVQYARKWMWGKARSTVAMDLRLEKLLSDAQEKGRTVNGGGWCAPESRDGIEGHSNYSVALK